MIGDDERKQLLREIETLIDDFKTLRLADSKGSINTERESKWSRSPIAKPPASTIRLLNRNGKALPSSWISSQGLELKDIAPKTVEEFQAAQVHYVKGTGQPIPYPVLKSGWSSWHEIELSGVHADATRDAIERTNAWVSRRCRFIWQGLFAGRGAIFSEYCWPDVVLEIATHCGDATMTKPAWRVEIGCVELVADEDGTQQLEATNKRQRQRMSLDIWNRRHDSPMKGAEPWVSITKADELFIGDDEPELMHCAYELKPFLRDSELALDWLRRRFEDHPQSHQPNAIDVAIPKKRSTNHRQSKNTTETNRPAQEKLEAAFVTHHKYENGSIGNSAPLTIGILAGMAETSKSTSKAFFDQWFKGIQPYKADALNGQAKLRVVLMQIQRESLVGAMPNYGTDPDSYKSEDD
jgi:hypothetical protein